MTKMRSLAIIFMIGIASLMLVLADSNTSSESTIKAPRSISRIYKLPEIFNWRKFTAIYHKTYDTLEAVWRKSVYLARCLKVFFHNILYSSEKSDYYQSINSLSDRFQSEIDGMYPRNSGVDSHGGQQEAYEGQDEIKYEHLEFAIQEQQLEQGMAKIIDENRDGYEVIVEAMEDEAHNIQKRSIEIHEPISISDRKLKRKIRNEIRKPKSNRLSPKLVYSLEPTNPFYEEPVIKSKSTATNTGKSLNKMEISRLENSVNKGNEFVDNEWHNLERKMIIGSDKQQSRPHNEAGVEKSIDWRNTQCFSPIKYQGTCGSCTYFATIALLEYEHCVQEGSLIQFSEQYLIDCGLRVDKSRYRGCDGAAFQYMNLLVQSYGLEIQNMYPYEGVNGECAVPSSLKAHQRGRFRLTISDNIFSKDVNITMLDSMLERGPVVASVYAPEDFESYGGGGPHDGNNCSLEKGHSMLIIGSGVSSDGTPYYLMRNSYGSDFGVNGHFLLAKSAVNRGCFQSVMIWQLKFDPKRDSSKTLNRKRLL